jgi:hypothetical protein
VACSFPSGAHRVALVCAAGLLTSLTGCIAAGAEPVPTTASTIPHGVAIPRTSPTPSSSVVADDVLLVVTGHATADNGATASVTATVHAPLSPDDPAAAEMVSRMAAFCAGEVDRGVLSDVDSRLVRVDDRSTLLSGTWPIDLPLALGPDSTSAFVTAAAGGGVFQEQVLPADPDPADYVPRCAEPAFLAIGRSGSVYLAEHFEKTNNIGLDEATFWGHLRYGFSTPYDLFSAQRVTLDDCTFTLTALGTAHLGDNPDFRVTTGPDNDPGLGDTCVAGGLTGH